MTRRMQPRPVVRVFDGLEARTQAQDLTVSTETAEQHNVRTEVSNE